jgi:hypothetical protein
MLISMALIGNTHEIIYVLEQIPTRDLKHVTISMPSGSWLTVSTLPPPPNFRNFQSAVRPFKKTEEFRKHCEMVQCSAEEIYRGGHIRN